MASQQEWYHIHPSGRQLWYKIQDKRGRNAPHTCTPREILDHTRLDWESLQWHHTELFLQGRHTGHLHVRICKGTAPQVSAPHSKPTPSLPTPMEPPHNYGSKEPQLTHQAHESPKLASSEANTVQQVVGNFLFYACAVDTKMIVSLNIIAAEQANSTEATAKSVTHLLNYATTYPEDITRYHASVMTLQIHRDASFISEPGAKIRAEGYHYLSTSLADPKNTPPKQPPLNRPVHVECTTMRNVLANAMEA